MRSGQSSLQIDRGLVKKLSSIFLRLPGNMACRVYASAGFTHNSSGSYLNVNTFDTVRYDTGPNRTYPTGFWDAANPERITITHAGFYIVSAYIAWTSDVNGQRGAYIIDSNSRILTADTRNAALGSLATSLNIHSEPVRFVPGDYVLLNVMQNTGGSLAVLSGLSTSWHRCDFAVHRVP